MTASSGRDGPVLSHHADEEYWFEEGCHVLEILNDPADPGASVARVRVPPGGTTRWHRLRGVTERYLIQSGRGEVGVGQGPAHAVTAGDVVLIPPEVRQRIHNPGPEELVFLAVCTPRFTRECYSDMEA